MEMGDLIDLYASLTTILSFSMTLVFTIWIVIAG